MFVVPNFADTYRFLVVPFQEGPGKRGHLDICGAKVARLSGNTGVEPSMFPLEHLHQIEAADPRAQATFPCCRCCLALQMWFLQCASVGGLWGVFLSSASLPAGIYCITSSRYLWHHYQLYHITIATGVDSFHFRAVWILSTRRLSVVGFVVRRSGSFLLNLPAWPLQCGP